MRKLTLALIAAVGGFTAVSAYAEPATPAPTESPSPAPTPTPTPSEAPHTH